MKHKTTLFGLDPTRFEGELQGKKTCLFILKNLRGMEVCISNFGGRIVSVLVPDRNGEMRDVVLGFDNLQDYIDYPTDFGATIGRYANRIAGAQFAVDGNTVRLRPNNFGHSLHGGPDGWQYRVFDARQADATTLELSLTSPDGDENFPGTMQVTVCFRLTEENAIEISYRATTDKKTVINLTNHSYFNLSGHPEKPATDHVLLVDADKYTPIDNTFMTTGEIAPVAGTPMDFRTPKAIGKEIDDLGFEQLKNGHGYDHNWILNARGDSGRMAARLVSPGSGIVLEVFTDEPGMQVYTGNFLDGTLRGKKGIVYGRRSAVCLETQHYPNSPNNPQWPSPYLSPGDTYRSRTVFRFSVS